MGSYEFFLMISPLHCSNVSIFLKKRKLKTKTVDELKTEITSKIYRHAALRNLSNINFRVHANVHELIFKYCRISESQNFLLVKGKDN